MGSYQGGLLFASFRCRHKCVLPAHSLQKEMVSEGGIMNQLHYSVWSLSDVKMVWWNSRLQESGWQDRQKLQLKGKLRFSTSFPWQYTSTEWAISVEQISVKLAYLYVLRVHFERIPVWSHSPENYRLLRKQDAIQKPLQCVIKLHSTLKLILGFFLLFQSKVTKREYARRMDIFCSMSGWLC